MTVDPCRLDGLGIAVTLTTRDFPAGPEAWTAMIAALLDWSRRRGMIRYHWVTEWQKRGAPHLHAVIFFDALAYAGELDRQAEREGFPPGYVDAVRSGRTSSAAQHFATSLAAHWTGSIAAPLAAHRRSQHVVSIETIDGWFKYLAKHAYRGATHYQRAGAALPPGWASTGRLWAKGGDWPTSEDAFEVDQRTFFRFRRLSRRWQRAQVLFRLDRARAWNNPHQLRAARAELVHLARAGSGKPRPDDMKAARKLLARALAIGNQVRADLARELIARQAPQLADCHRRASVVRGVSAHMPEAVSRQLLAAAIDHETGHVQAWLSRSERLAQARADHLSERVSA